MSLSSKSRSHLFLQDYFRLRRFVNLKRTLCAIIYLEFVFYSIEQNVCLDYNLFLITSHHITSIEAVIGQVLFVIFVECKTFICILRSSLIICVYIQVSSLFAARYLSSLRRISQLTACFDQTFLEKCDNSCL